MLRYSFYISFVLLLWTITSTSAQCGPGSFYSSETNKCFQYFKAAVDYKTAESICATSSGHLASIHNAIENTYIAQQAQTHIYRDGPVWLGAVSSSPVVTNPKNWKWSDLSAFDYQNYRSGQPSALGDGACMQFQVGTAKWLTAGCDDQYPFICAFEPNEIQETTTCPPQKSHNCPSGYYWLEETDACYKPVIEKVNVTDVLTVCEKENAHLASIHSKVENDFLTEITRTGLNISDPHYYNGLYIGLIYSSGNWQWTDGTPLDYSNWAKGEPNNMGFEFWTALLPDPGLGDYDPNGGQWNNVAKLQRGYICKTNPI